MTQYAQYNPSVTAPSPVTGWYDTGALTYPNLPPPNDLLAVTADQWNARLTNPSAWAVSAGALVAYTPPAPPVDTRVPAKAALDKSDMTALRCFKAGVAFPAEWQTYVLALRAIVAGTSTVTVLPTQPAYPVGT